MVAEQSHSKVSQNKDSNPHLEGWRRVEACKYSYRTVFFILPHVFFEFVDCLYVYYLTLCLPYTFVAAIICSVPNHYSSLFK